MPSIKSGLIIIAAFIAISMFSIYLLSLLIPYLPRENLNLFTGYMEGNNTLTITGWALLAVIVTLFLVTILLGVLRNRFVYVSGALTGILFGMFLYAGITGQLFVFWTDTYLT
jgi:hypothetical protein